MILPLGIYSNLSENICPYQNFYMNVALLYIVTKPRNNSMSITEWVNWYNNIWALLLSNKKDKLLIHATMWTNLIFFKLSGEGHKVQLLYDSISMTIWKRQNYRDRADQ